VRTVHRAIGYLAVATVIAACSGDRRSSSTAPVVDGGARLRMTPAAVTLRPLQSQRIQLALPDGSPITTPIQWTVSSPRVAYIFGDTLVRGTAEGSATVTATTAGFTGSIVVTVPADLSIGEFTRPIATDVVTSNVFDHDLPYEFKTQFSNGYLLSFWGDRLPPGVDSHNGYDWVVPTGTPVLAAGRGRVVFAGSEQPFVCSFLNDSVVSAMYVQIAHGVKPDELIETLYVHLSRIDVKTGDEVASGQQIGLSGNTGCSTGPHLHFGALRIRGTENRIRVMDPYGWTASGPDPWVADTGGVASVALWKSTSAPKLYGEWRFGDGFANGERAAVYAVRYWGIDDAHNPNNEFVAFYANPALGTIDISGWTLRNAAGDRYTFSSGTSLNSMPGISLLSGTGTSSPLVKYWGRTSGVWANSGDCAQLYDAAGVRVSSVSWGSGSCGVAVRAARSVTPVRDAMRIPTVMEMARP
jgi:hypothetical protein